MLGGTDRPPELTPVRSSLPRIGAASVDGRNLKLKPKLVK